MKRALLLCALGTAFFAAQAAHADPTTTYDLTFSGCFGSFSPSCSGGTSFSDGGNVQFSVLGTPVEPGFGSNSYAIEDISGTVVIGGDTYQIGNLMSGAGSLSPFGSNNLNLDSHGNYAFDDLDFALTPEGSGTYDELMFYYNTATGEYTDSYTYSCGTRRDPKTCTATGTYLSFDLYVDQSVTPGSPSATPEPGSLALLGTAILGAAGVMRRRFVS